VTREERGRFALGDGTRGSAVVQPRPEDLETRVRQDVRQGNTVIGGARFGLQVKGMAKDVGQIVIGKLIIHPLIILIAFLIIPGIDPLYMVGAVLFSAAPMISIYPLLGQRYGLGGVSAATMLVATVASFFTLSLIIWLMTMSGLMAF